MTPETIITLVASPVLGGAAAKLWQWWTTRDATKLAAAADDAKRAHELTAARVAADATASGSVLDLMQRLLTSGEERAERSAARAEAIGAALSASASAMGANTSALDDLRRVLTAHAEEEVTLLREMRGTLAAVAAALLPQDTGEQPRASMVPNAMRAPTPPLPAIPAPPRRSP